jgi:stage II sporulation protein D
MRSPAAAAGVLAALTASALLAGATPAAAAGPAPATTRNVASAAARDVAAAVPASRVLTVSGHGWGHGRGMSQNGAYGAAARFGRTSAQILDFYYPGTRSTRVADRALRVQLRTQEAAGASTALDVENPGELTVRDEAAAKTYVVPRTTSARWRVQPTATGLRVLYLKADPKGAVWTPWRTFAGPVGVDAKGRASTHVLAPLDRRYTSSSIRVLQQRSASGQRLNRQTMVARMGLESYLRGVVPLESPTSWPLAALQAQAVAARSYTTYKLDHVAAGAAYDICDTTACQVYGGDNARNAHSDAAVGTTAGLVRTYAGRAILAEFSSSNGGWTTSGGAPYLPAKADSYDGAMPSTVHAWRATLSAAALERAYPNLGRLKTVQVLTRDGRGEWGGRVLTVRLTGDRATLVVPGRDVYVAAAWPTDRTGLRSSWWSITP